MPKFSVLIVLSILVHVASALESHIDNPELKCQYLNVGFKCQAEKSIRMDSMEIFGVLKNSDDDVVYTLEESDSTMNGDILEVRYDKDVNPGDVLNYWLLHVKDGIGYVSDNLDFTFEEKDAAHSCMASITEVRNRGVVCAGDLIFEEHFDHPTLVKWTKEIRFPDDNQERPFVSYEAEAVSVVDGSLSIEIGLRKNVTRELTLQDCTSVPKFCKKKGKFIPPVISGRVTTKNSFSFKYGKVEIMARVPKGQWVYPELYLMPSDEVYGDRIYDNGIIRIAFVDLNNIDDYSGIIKAGLLLTNNYQCRPLLTKDSKGSKDWSDSFYNYTVVWKDDAVQFYARGEIIGQVKEPVDGFKTYKKKKADSACQATTRCLTVKNDKWNSKFAPFDQMFHLVIGVGVGGVSDYSDDEPNKPWNNNDTLASYNFGNGSAKWFDTVKIPSLLVDYVKVWAI